MAQTGIITIGNFILGFDARTCYVEFDIAPELKSERHIHTSAFERYTSWKYCVYEYILYTFTTRYIHFLEEGSPYSEKYSYVHWAVKRYDERYAYYEFIHNEVKCFCEGLFTHTPLLLKNFKYNNWQYIPNVITPEFYIWSFYELDINSVEIMIHNKTTNEYIVYTYNTDKDKFEIEKLTDYVWKIKLSVDVFFENGTEIDIYISVYDVHGNALKEGLW